LEGQRRAGEQTLLRGEAPLRAPELESPVTGPDGTIRLAWSAVEGAERYEVRLYSTTLVELARLPATPDTLAELRREHLPSKVPTGSSIIWRVAALRGSEELGISTPGSLIAP
jgi:hypothetical protein